MNPADQLNVVTSIARAAGALILEHYGRVERLTKTHSAADNEAVTAADRASQRLIVSRLREHFPSDGIVGEEDDSGSGITFDVRDPMGRVWVIDPIDGTNNFIAGLGAFCVCIGLLERGEPVLGVVYNVTRGTLHCGARGLGATIDGKRSTALTTPLTSRSIVCLTGTLYNDSGKLPDWAIKLLGPSPWKPRMLGSAALEGALVGAGVASIAIQTRCKLWDVVAAAAVTLEAGGSVTDLSGKPIFPFDLRGYSGARVPFVMGGPQAHREIIALINGNR